MFWGLTPSLNLLEEVQVSENQEAINILLFGGCDARHILHTLSENLRRFNNKKINFYVIELAPEILAKQLLLLNIALTPAKEFGVSQKARIFMELYGNCLVRPTTAKFLSNRAKDFIEMITNDDYLKQQMPTIKLDIKYKERDYMENLYKFWSSKDEFDIMSAWDRRLRRHLGARYDTRHGAFDWDLHMRLHLLGAKVVNNQEYQSFRRSGVAFTWLDSEVTKPNRSMVTGIIRNGDDFAHYGYLGEMQTGPFIAYGIQCKNPDMLKKVNNMYKHRSTDVTERNLREIFHNIENATPYEHKDVNDMSLGACVMQIPDLKVVDVGNYIASKQKFAPCLNLENVSINILSISKYEMMKHKEAFKELFNVIYFGYHCTKYLLPDILSHVASDNASLIIENQLYILNSREKQLEEYYIDILDKLRDIEKYACSFDFKKDPYIRYIVTK